ncbi:MAG: ABC transporter transmembrane domain-containing protein, partial [Chloroflexia bacterium]
RVLLKPHWLREVEVLVYMLFGLSYGIVLPLSGKFLIDTVIPGKDLGKLGLFVAGLFTLYLVNALVGMRRGYVSSWINQQIVKRLDEKLFAHMQRLSHSFYSEVKLGDIMSRFTTDMQMVQNAANQVISSGPYMLLTGLLAGTTVLILNPILGVVVLVIVPFFVISYLTLGPKLQKASVQRQKLVGELVSSLQENLSAHAVVKAYGLEQKANSAFKKSLEAMEKASMRVVKIGVLFETSMSLAVTLGQLLVLGGGGFLVMQGQLTIGTLLAFIGLLPSLIQPISTLSSIGQTVKTASGAISRVTELLDEPVVIDDKPNAPDLPTLHNEIRFQGVDFSYGSGNPILDSLSLRIRAGANVAIVGPSGSGKSTIVSLLMRFYDPEQGSITFDGTDIRDAKLASLRDQIGLVFQDTFIFDTTVRENIAHGKPGATDVEILAAAKAAQLHTFIEGLPSGYDTVLGERGVRMSGGQRQRLAIARALIREPAILLLDEATSALDSHTEREILDTLNTVAIGRTVISITHRLAIAAAADRIYVLDHGKLVEEGAHADLVYSGGLYGKLYQEQTKGAQQAEGTGIELGLVQAVPLFSGFPETLLTSIARKMGRERFFEGEKVVAEGEPGDKLYIVQRGSLEVIVGNENTPGGERKVNTLHAPDYFGEMTLLTGEPRSATVRAAEPTEVLSLSRADFLNLLDHEETLRASVQSTVTSRSEALELARGSAAKQAVLSR